MPLLTTVLASDNRQILDRARAGLAADKAVRTVRVAQEGEGVLRLVRRRRPALLVVDLALPPGGGLAVLTQVRRQSRKTRVLVIDQQLDEGRALQVAKAGAHGYMLEEAIPAYLAKAVRVMAAGEAWFSRRLMARVVEELQRLARFPTGGKQRRPAVYAETRF